MPTPDDLIPPPATLRTRLAENIRERRLLRALLRLASRARVADAPPRNDRETTPHAPATPSGREVSR